MDDKQLRASPSNSEGKAVSISPARQGRTSKDLVCICVATCRRPLGLHNTLLSLAALTFDGTPQPRIRVIVVDNDAKQEGLEVVARLAGDFLWELQGVYEPARGISYARNTLVQAAADADFIVFIDDDEYAQPQWLDELLNKARTTGATVVLGPVRYELQEQPPNWLRGAYNEIHRPDGTEVPVGSFRTGNLLISPECLKHIAGPFDPDFALTGGGDSFLGQQLHMAGIRFIWAAKAIVYETVPPSRISLRRYLVRRYRSGMVYSMVQQRLLGMTKGTIRAFYRGIGSIVMALLDCLLAIFRGTQGLVSAFGLASYGLGIIAGSFGHRYREYDRIHGS